jgi:hypothetical protein
MTTTEKTNLRTAFEAARTPELKQAIINYVQADADRHYALGAMLAYITESQADGEEIDAYQLKRMVARFDETAKAFSAAIWVFRSEMPGLGEEL